MSRAWIFIAYILIDLLIVGGVIWCVFQHVPVSKYFFPAEFSVRGERSLVGGNDGEEDACSEMIFLKSRAREGTLSQRNVSARESTPKNTNQKSRDFALVRSNLSRLIRA